MKIDVDVINLINGENCMFVSEKLMRNWYMVVMFFVKVKVCISFKIRGVEGDEILVKL